METWLIFAIASIFFAWFNTFLLKVVSQRNYDTNQVLLMRYSSWAFFAFCLYVYTSWWNFDFTLIYILLAFWFAKMLTTYFVSAFKIEWMRYMDSVIFLPMYKTFSVTFVTISSIFLFSESLSFYNIIWIILWLLVPILLITKKESKNQMNLQKWLVYTFSAAFILMISASMNKYVNEVWFNLELFTFIFLFLWIFLSYYKLKTHKKTSTEIEYNTKWIYSFWILLWLLTFLTSWTMIKAFSWNMAVVYTMNSFSILIPIILSVIVYKEEMTIKKAFVILLSIVSVILFI